MNNRREKKKQAKEFIKRWENRGNERQDMMLTSGKRLYDWSLFSINNQVRSGISVFYVSNNIHN